MGVDKMGTIILFTEEKMEKIFRRQNEKCIKLLSEQKRKELDSIRNKIKGMRKCKESN